MKIYAIKKTVLFVLLLVLFLFLAFLFGVIIYVNNDLDLLIFLFFSITICLCILLYLVNRNYDIFIDIKNEEIISNVWFNNTNQRHIFYSEIVKIELISGQDLQKIYKKKLNGKKYISILLKSGKLEIIPCFWLGNRQIKSLIESVV